MSATASYGSLSRLEEKPSGALRSLNLTAGVLCLVATVFFAVDAAVNAQRTLPVMAGGWLLRMRGGTPDSLPPLAYYSTVVDSHVRLQAFCYLFTGLAALDHLWVATARRLTYESYLLQGMSPYRWAEYAVSASLMNVLIGMLSGVLDVYLLMSIGVLTATCMCFGAMGEVVDPKYARRVFWLGCVPFLAAWAIIAGSFFLNVDQSITRPPDFVYAIIFVLFFLECLFGWNQIRVTSYLYREATFILLSPTAKLSLAFMTWGGLRSL